MARQSFRTFAYDGVEWKRHWRGVPVLSLRKLASIAIAVFFCGTTVLPTLHLAFHTLPHEHAAPHSHEHSAPHEHEAPAHHEHEHHSDAGAEPHEHDSEPDHHEPLDREHGDRSLAHFSAAIGSEAAQPWTPTPIALICAGRIAAEERAAPQMRVARAHGVRGPPTLLL
ncbi:MAG TPA: hypothetical protein VE010_17375 [Thermoanaerobaculia bacterium]|nr:hypothetical protein [Thermoanaerobaculia bacterium]